MIRSPIRGGGSGGGFALVPGATGARITGPALVSPLVTLTRAQVSSFSTVVGVDGFTIEEFTADTPRYFGATRALFRDPQRTNGFTNPRCEGAAPGTPGTMPTGWTISATQGLSVNVVGTGVEDGLAYVDIQFVGTPTSTGNVQITPGGTPVAADGQVWTLSMFTRLVAGSLANVGNAITALQVGGGAANPTYTLASTRLGLSRRSATATAAGGATIATGRWRCGVTSGLAVDFTVRFAAPQVEQGSLPSSVILPPVGSPTASARGADNITAPFAALFPAAQGSILFRAILTQAAASGADQILFQLDDGTDSNRIRLRNPAGGATLVAGVVIGGTPTDAASLGSFTAGAEVKGCITFAPGGRVAVLLDGGSVLSVATSPSGLATLRFGDNASGTAPLVSGAFSVVDTLPYIIPDLSMQAAITATP
jgi:hypothetical protein